MAQAKKPAKPKAKAEEPKEKQIKHAEVVAEAAPVGSAPPAEIGVKPAAAKAGKRSPKAVKEVEEKQEKELRKTAKPAAAADKPKPVKVARTRAERAGKKYREAVKL